MTQKVHSACTEVLSASNHSVPNWTIFLANSKQNLHPFSTLLYDYNNHKSKPYSGLVASNTVLLFTEMMTLLAAKKPNGFDFSDIQIIRLFLLFTFVLIHQPVSKKTNTNDIHIYIFTFFNSYYVFENISSQANLLF